MNAGAALHGSVSYSRLIGDQ